MVTLHAIAWVVLAFVHHKLHVCCAHKQNHGCRDRRRAQGHCALRNNAKCSLVAQEDV